MDLQSNVGKVNEKLQIRCKWWNRGFSREKDQHHEGDCQDHLLDRCLTKGCRLRHRKPCKYFATTDGCHRNDKCQYLHQSHKDPIQADDTEKTKLADLESYHCKNENEINKVQFKDTKVICILRRAILSEEEWEHIEETVVNSKMNTAELLEDFTKMLRYHRLSDKNGNNN